MSVPVEACIQNDVAVNTLPRVTEARNGQPRLGTSNLSDDGNSLKYKGVPVAGGGSTSLDIQGHANIGVGSVADSQPNDNFYGWFPDKTVLIVRETATNAEVNGLGAIYAEVDWNPTSDVSPTTGTQALGVFMLGNLDGQATDDTSLWGLYVQASSIGNVRKLFQESGATLEVDHIGNNDVQHLFAAVANVNKAGSGSVTEDMIAVLAQAQVDAGHVAGLWSLYVNPVVINGDALVDGWRGLHIHAPLNNSSNPIGDSTGIQIDVFKTDGTTTHAINSTGDAPSDFAGDVNITKVSSEANATAVSITHTLNPATNQGGENLFSELDINCDGASSKVVNATGIDSEVFSHGNLNKVAELAALYGYVENQGHATVDLVEVLQIDTIVNSGGGAITDAYGIKIFDQTQGVTNHAIKSGAGLVEFGDTLILHKTQRSALVYSVAGTPLPSAVTEGMGTRAFVSDATSAVFNAAYTGGGTNKMPVFSDGTVWRIG